MASEIVYLPGVGKLVEECDVKFPKVAKVVVEFGYPEL